MIRMAVQNKENRVDFKSLANPRHPKKWQIYTYVIHQTAKAQRKPGVVEN